MAGKYRSAGRGQQIIQFQGVMLITLMVSALAIDFGYYFAAQNRLQTAADAAALAATTELYRGIEVDPEVRLKNARAAAVDFVDYNEPGLKLPDGNIYFGYINPDSKTYDSATFSTPSVEPGYSATKGFNAVFVTVDRAASGGNLPLKTIMANMFGVSSMNAEAHSVALVDQSVNAVTDGGLRPIYACEAQIKKTMEDGILDNNVIRVYGDHLEVDGVGNLADCPLPGSGNWGFADFTNCGSGTIGSSTISDWFADGYQGTVETGKCYSTKPGNFISSISPQLDKLITDKTSFPIPFYKTWAGSGSNTYVNISGFVGFQMTSYKANGPEAGRYMQGHFVRYVCNKGCTSGNNGNATIGGAVVKLRLAAQS